MATALPYCGTPPSPETLLHRFNLDPVLIAALVLCVGAHFLYLRRRERAGESVVALGGWLIAAAALLSPLCALSVSLFSARIAQHMVLVLIAAPMLALALPRLGQHSARRQIWLATCAFLVALWFWHMPAPYDATFESTPVYWTMHLTLSGSAVWLWRCLLRSPRVRSGDVLAAGAASSMQMGFLGAILTMADRPLYFHHLQTTWVWGLTPLQDQALGGTLMWVPGIVLFLWAGVYALGRLRTLADGRTLPEA